MDEALPFLLLSYVAYVLGTTSPGPNILAILETSIAEGRRAATALALGIVTGSLFWGMLSVFGITYILIRFPPALLVMQVCGALYLIYLSYRSLRAAFGDDPMAGSTSSRTTLVQRYFRGLLIQVTNPKSAITWLTVYSIALTKSGSLGLAYSVVLGNMVLSLMIHMGYAAFFSGRVVRGWLLGYRKFIQLSIAAFFFALSMLLLAARTGGL